LGEEAEVLRSREERILRGKKTLGEGGVKEGTSEKSSGTKHNENPLGDVGLGGGESFERFF